MKNFVRRIIAQLLSRLPKGLYIDPQFFPIYEARGLHMTPAHFYQPVPTISEIDDAVWSAESEMVGIDMNLDDQEKTVDGWAKKYLEEYRSLGTRKFEAKLDNIRRQFLDRPGYRGIDGFLYFSMIRSAKPHRLIEIGAGGSTLLSILASAINEEEGGHATEIISIEPYPQQFVRDAMRGRAELIEKRVETVPLSLFEKLGESDILFIDSSHVVKVGSDVVYEINEILPRLNKGVSVHVHDICFPFNYSKKWIVDEHKFWSEQYMLQAFLSFNRKFAVTWCSAFVHAKRPEIFRRHFSAYKLSELEPGFAGPIWMSVVH